MSSPKLYFTADPHYGHARILEYCKGRAALWSSVEAMNLGLAERWNDTVTDDDFIVVLGDFSMGKREDTVKYGQWLRGRWKGLVPGNHDMPWEHGRDGKGTTDSKLLKHRKDYYEWGGFNHIHQPPVVCGSLIPTIHPLIHNAILTHLPPVECGDHKAGEAVYENEVRFVEQRPAYPPDDTWMLCGHVHEAWKRHGRVINVGVDVWDYAPVSAERLVQYMEESA